ncbi:MAG: hypothetical protein ACP5P4_07155 [Steroidobacteraceae bacterium]
MTEVRFRALQRALIGRGVATRHARRAALELQSHYEQLREEGLERGAASAEAERRAHDALGADGVLIDRYAGREELKTWLCRWPLLCIVGPLASFVAACVSLMALLVMTLNALHLAGYHYTVPALAAAAVNSAFEAAMLWVLPVAVAGLFGVRASGRPIPVGALISGVLLVCLAARLMNVGLMLPVAGHSGSASMGLRIASSAIVGELTPALITTAVALTPYFILRQRLVSVSLPHG